MNKIILIGNLTKDPDLRSTKSGTSVCSFDIAVNRRFVKKDGEKVTDFFRITTWGSVAENCSKYLAKGRKVAVVGELQASIYEGKDGRTYLNLTVQAEEVEFLTPNGKSREEKQELPSMDEYTDLTSDDIPF